MKYPPRGSFDYLLEAEPPPIDELIHERQRTLPGQPLQRPRKAPRPATPPPPPKEPEGRRQKVTVNIEINQVRQVPPRRYGHSLVWAVILVALLCAVLAGCAQAQPTQWRSYQQGFSTMLEGEDKEGRSWTGRAYMQGFTTFADFNGPDGKVLHCQSYELSGVTHTNCSP